MSRVDMHAALLEMPTATAKTGAAELESLQITCWMLSSQVISQKVHCTKQASWAAASPGFVCQAQLRRNRRKAAALHDRLDNICPLSVQELLAGGHCPFSVPLRPLSCC